MGTRRTTDWEPLLCLEAEELLPEAHAMPAGEAVVASVRSPDKRVIEDSALLASLASGMISTELPAPSSRIWYSVGAISTVKSSARRGSRKDTANTNAATRRVMVMVSPGL